MIELLSYGRRLLQVQDVDASQAIASQSSPDFRPPFGSNSPFDSSLALTILVLLTALFFMAFFSLYIRRYSAEAATTRRQPPPPLSRTAKCRGLDPSAVSSLPLVSYAGDAKHWGECSICLSEFEERETVKMIPYCRHGFHPLCIDTWLSSHVSCPLCRSTQLFPAVDEVRLGVAVTDRDRDPTVDNAR